MNGIVKKWALALLGNYSIYFVYRREGGAESASATAPNASFDFRRIEEGSARVSADPLVQAQIQYFGPGAHAFACLNGSRFVGLCFYWAGDRYRQRNFWPLADDEAKLVQIMTLPDMRGRGIAGSLIEWSSQAMIDGGFRRLYARIWHSNNHSWRAFERARWKRIALVIEINPLRRSRPFRVSLGRKPLGRWN